MKSFKKNKTILILMFVFLLAFLFRLWKVTEVPPSLYWDEVSQGYNAYSILTTGKDEHEELLPIARFIAFGDYKAPVYTYLIVPFMAVFGKGELAVRLPSVILGSLTVLFTFFLTRELFIKDRRKEIISLISAGILAVLPWHVQLSRGAYEGNVATFFTILGGFLWLYAVRRKSWVIILAIVSFVLAFYSFNSHRVFIPLLALLLAGVYFRELWGMKKNVIVGSIIGIVLLVPYLLFLMSPESRLRFQEVNIFSDLSVIEESNRLQELDNHSLLSKFTHNRRVLYGREYVENYFDFYDPNFLFFEGDINPRFSHRNNGQLYLWQLPFILVGIYQFAKGERKRAYLLFAWLALAPVAAATARETPHALRAEMFLPLYSIFTSFGIVATAYWIKAKKKIAYQGFIFLVAAIFVFSVSAFAYNYLTHFPKEFSSDWQYGYKEAVQKVEEIKEDYSKIYFTREYGRPYIYALFYGDYRPQEFWNDAEVTRDAFGFYEVYKVGKYHFPYKMPDTFEDNVLLVGAPGQIPEGFRQLDEVKFLDGRTAFILATNDEE